MSSLLASELVLTPQGAVYHLGIKPEDLAHKVIVVGDQDRVALVASFFDEITHKSQHREFACQTGIYKGKRITALSTGIGTDNIDIVVNELDALVNIDLQTREEKAQQTSLDIVRIGTCGILHADIPVGSFILSTHALGIDNVGHFYKRNQSEEVKKLEQEIEKRVKLPQFVKPYLTEASPALYTRLNSNKVESGITVTSSGFYGPQGRRLRIPLVEEGMLDSFSDFSFEAYRMTNLEMECSALFSISSALGHQAIGICLGIANRRRKEFISDYSTEMNELVKYVLDRI
ncbi:MAG: nucleoside phosphorylase [Brumimicrobium sp.]|nr:nucleoside phosphorylase [Brumimicrobium sp.]MCO5268161.1 nucleoside phosphorylase [Brumimicrobium sp.]